MLDPAGPLYISKVIPYKGIKAANKEVTKVVDSVDAKCTNASSTSTSTTTIQQLSSQTSRGPYERFTLEEKAQIGKRAAEHRVAATSRYCSKHYHGRLVKESTSCKDVEKQVSQ